ncbi:hypothetical protein SDC9_59240 [bioreactor metagenome]|uniref:Uncharacterized protein n=1 Tax=bioreactor metagenome TaxID=1076179 RepID=A0A644X9M1_9ZZZZ
MVGLKLDDARRDHVEKFLDFSILTRRSFGFRLLCHRAFFLSELILNMKKPSHFCDGGIRTILFTVDNPEKKE